MLSAVLNLRNASMEVLHESLPSEVKNGIEVKQQAREKDWDELYKKVSSIGI